MAKKNYEELATQIIEKIGGKDNVQLSFHCATRLRFNLKDLSLANKDEIEKIKGVVAVQITGDQLQIIIGNHVKDVHKEVVKQGGFLTESTTENQSKQKVSIFNQLTSYVSGSFLPLIPGMLGCAMLLVITSVLSTFNLIDTEGDTYRIISYAGNAFNYFVPIMLAYTAAQKVGANPFLAMAVGAILLSPDLSALFAEGDTSFLGMPVTAATYANSVFPILLIVPVLAYVERYVDKFTPDLVKIFMVPLITILIILPLSLVVLGPLGTILGEYLAQGVDFLYTKMSIVTLMLLCAFFPFIVMTGMHYALIPLCTAYYLMYGFDPLILIAMMVNNFAQGSAAIGVSMKSKDSETKQLALSTGISCILAGITEPAMYGVNLRFKTPLYAAMIGGGIAGIVAGIFKVAAYGGVPNIFGLVGFFGGDGGLNNVTYGIIMAVVALLAPFIICQFIYKENVEIIQE